MISRKLAAADPANVEAQRDLGVSLNNVGVLLSAMGDREGALKLYQESLVISRKLAAVDPANVQAQRDVGVCLGNVGDLLVATGDRDGALKLDQESLVIRRKIAAADPANVKVQVEVIASLSNVGSVRAKSSTASEIAEGIALYKEALTRIEPLKRQGLLDASQAGWPDLIAKAIQAAEAKTK